MTSARAKAAKQPSEQGKAIEILRSEPLSAIPWLLHGFSTRHGGASQAYGGEALNLGITPQDSPTNVERNREIFLRGLGATDVRGRLWPVASLRQVHSSAIHSIMKVPPKTLGGDGLVTDRRGILLGIRVADCLPILVADSERRAVGAFHAGWRGTLARIAEKGIGQMRLRFGSDPAHIVAAIGPGIHSCCYEVSQDLRDKFSAQFAYADLLFEEVASQDEVRRKYPLLFMNQRAPGHGEPPAKLHLDLVEANRRQLLDAGVPEENIDVIDLCTSCRTDLLFSHRAEAGATGRMMGAIGIV